MSEPSPKFQGELLFIFYVYCGLGMAFCLYCIIKVAL